MELTTATIIVAFAGVFLICLNSKPCSHDKLRCDGKKGAISQAPVY